uniref:Putative HNH homing endonuclease n=1 Tax=Oedogonium cardiacum TaxID=55995 RepID=B2X1W6_OEDCA|nr:putative HNH homing endonuclease [Oedogonium cardiacum]YP_002000460.1 putative HNH homing endonuclease [Oedogonium cardiacum]ABU88179.1 putative site-specific DNA endonuclease [Oedogonium cardiacum]ACC97280.1 putative HNH homing endonuclease [Oedogonium cardiacum]ACC97296.1 putative HNH homing endonuclease [Oedogonium cardiacum]
MQFKNIKTRKDLSMYLNKERNYYTQFLLNKMQQQNQTLKNLQKHHIIPKHWGGPDESWNIISLSVEDHAYAHKLLFENYNNYYDFCAASMLQGKTSEGLEALRKANQKKMQELGVGFYNSDLQRELAKRPKKQRQCYSRNSYVKAALERGFMLQDQKNSHIVIIQPFECKSLVDVIDKLMNQPHMIEERENWHQLQKKEKSYWITGLTRTLTGHICKKIGKCVFSFKGWRVLGIFIVDFDVEMVNESLILIEFFSNFS